MTDLHVGKGPFFTLHRPYHLTSLETPLTAARAVLYGKADMQPLDHPVAETAALAKRDLAPGTVLGRIGERDYRGWSMTLARRAARRALLPIGLAERAARHPPDPARRDADATTIAPSTTASPSSGCAARSTRADRRFLPADAA